MSDITVIGTGYVGLVTGACFADLGNHVTCVDINPTVIDRLRRGEMTIYEPGLDDLVERNAHAGRLAFTSSYDEGLARSDFAFVAVDTPPGTEGEADLASVRRAAESIAHSMRGPLIVVNKSTVPIGTGDLVAGIIQRTNGSVPFGVASNPEFLREGSAVNDFLHPDRIVIGASDPAVAEKVRGLYATLDCPILITDLNTAELIKYASNAFLATRISFINEIAAICAAYGVDVKTVSRGMGLDKRIGVSTLEAGLGYGGSCFPKDIQALEHMAAIQGLHPELLRAVMEINRDQRRLVVQRLRDIFGSLDGRHIAVLGLSFKPNTDDVREAPALAVIRLLQAEGARVRAYDPVAVPAAQRLVSNVEFADSAYAAAAGCDALVVATEWNEFRQLDLGRLRESLRCPVVIDGRNIYDPTDMARLGFIYRGIGRGYDPIDQALIQSMTLAAL